MFAWYSRWLCYPCCKKWYTSILLPFTEGGMNFATQTSPLLNLFFFGLLASVYGPRPVHYNLLYIKSQLFPKIKYYQKISKFLAILSTKKYIQNPWKTAKMVTNCPNWSRWPMLKEFTSNLLQRDSVARWMIIFFQKSRMIFNEVGLLGRIRKAES